jgi:hypothetical protein
MTAPETDEVRLLPPFRDETGLLIPETAPRRSFDHEAERRWKQAREIECFEDAWTGLWLRFIAPATRTDEPAERQTALAAAEKLRNSIFDYAGTLTGDTNDLLKKIDGTLRLMTKVSKAKPASQRAVLRAHTRVRSELTRIRKRIEYPTIVLRLKYSLGIAGSYSLRLALPTEATERLERGVSLLYKGLSSRICSDLGVPEDVRRALEHFGVTVWNPRPAEDLFRQAHERYRVAAQRNHPDVGGLEGKIQVDNQHMEVLKRWYGRTL